MLKQLKVSATLIILGNVLYFALSFFSTGSSNFSEFTSGFLLGMAVGLNLIGIFLLVVAIVKYNKESKR